MRSLVLDASAGLNLVRREPDSERVADLIAARLEAGLAVPSLFWLEIVNVLARRHGFPAARILEAVAALREIGIATLQPDAAHVVEVIDLMERHDLTAYDAAYLALAISLDADLATADRRLALAAGDRVVFIGSEGGVAEDLATYRPHPVTWPSWPDAGAYLAELRSELQGVRIDPPWQARGGEVYR